MKSADGQLRIVTEARIFAKVTVRAVCAADAKE